MARSYVGLIWLCLVISGCQATDRTAALPDKVSVGWTIGQVLDARTGQPVSLKDWLGRLSTYDVIYLGEEHHNQFHVAAALMVLRSLVDQGRRPILAMEMFAWDGQPALEEYLAKPRSSRSEFLERVFWKQNWGGAFEDYELLVQFAREHRLSIAAMNPPKALIRQVVKQGLPQAKQGAEWRQWGMEGEAILDDPNYRARVLSQIQACHGGGAPEDYQTMYEASMVRDEGMAKTVAAALLRISQDGPGGEGPVVSYTGGGHVQYGLPVPNRVLRRRGEGYKQVTVYLATYEPERVAELSQMMEEGIADYVWLTAQGAQGPPRRCR